MRFRLHRTGTWMERLRVPLGFVCAAIFIILAQPEMATLLFGGAISLIGIALRAWSAGHIRKNAELTVSGPYAFTRNPLYLGSFLLGLGFAIASGRTILWIIFALLFLLIYLPVMKTEAETLRRLFSAQYDEYSHSVPLFLPGLIAYKPSKTIYEATTKFDLSLYMKHREYRAALGMVGSWALLAIKAMWLVRVR